jgi:methionyl-tRNA formyltransferase
MKTLEEMEKGTAVYTLKMNPKPPCSQTQKHHGYIDWERPAAAIVNQFRGTVALAGARPCMSRQNRTLLGVTIRKAQALDVPNPTTSLRNAQ